MLAEMEMRLCFLDLISILQLQTNPQETVEAGSSIDNPSQDSDACTLTKQDDISHCYTGTSFKILFSAPSRATGATHLFKEPVAQQGAPVSIHVERAAVVVGHWKPFHHGLRFVAKMVAMQMATHYHYLAFVSGMHVRTNSEEIGNVEKIGHGVVNLQ